MSCSAEVSWELDGITMQGTLARPAGAGPVPAVVLVAGSGPTDRDWCSPLLPGTNGSGRLFARAFAEAFPPHSNHVFKEDHRTVAEVAAAPGNGYNAEDTRLDPEALYTIIDWVQALSS